MVSIRTDVNTDQYTARMVVEGLPQPPSGEGLLPWRNVLEWTSNYPLDQSGRAWVQAMTPILMRAKETGVFADPQDAEALYNAELAEKMMHKWWKWMKDVRLSARTVEPVYPAGRGVGCFFSGGVDSFYSTLTNFDKITHLIFVKSGFDIFPANKELSEKTYAAMQLAAEAYGKPLITVETNVREVSSRFVRWGQRYHGAALATVGQLLAHHLEEVIIPSSYQQAEIEPWGSHPSLDHLWSSSYLRVRHDSVRPNRSEKVEAISSDPVAMQHLRVCWRNPNSEYNCGKCEKCVRTMISLYAFGALERCATFEDQIDREILRELDVRFGHLPYAIGNVELLREQRGEDDEIYRLLSERVAAAQAAKL
ncbi:hypothetical protein [Leucobacter triazinivorans]|uniref:7-cyano-7-deazaguanine synthase n=1 Tax=Leucobacter triazinivorans TaxID=1784719 RepID=A0A4P6KE34_9MICO|nr:hypothetical protein [Leucobacter triazinivorans]QBE48646.1 hypothetical protein EVS81_07220 [Leucobacter triazinivorans]